MHLFYRIIFILFGFLTIGLGFQNCQKTNPYTVTEDADTVNSLFGTGFGALSIKPNEKALGQTVLIEDDGFNFSHEVFKNKIKKKFTITCSTSAKNILSFDISKTKGEIIDSLSVPKNEGCQLSQVESFLVPTHELNSTELQTWNRSVIQKKSLHESSPIRTKAESYFDSLSSGTQDTSHGYGYHATFVSGLISYNNTTTRIVALDTNIDTNASHWVLSNLSSASCTSYFQSLESYVELLEDSDIQQALINQAPSQVEEALLEIYENENISLYNKSFGLTPALVAIAQKINNGCFNGPTQNGLENPYDGNYADYFNITFLSKNSAKWSSNAKGALDLYRRFLNAKGQIESKRYKKIFGNYLNKVMIVRASGNDAIPLDFDGDSDYCNPESIEFVVGSINSNGQKSDFSNFGKCVKLYMLGDDVISTVPNGVLKVANGTSYSAPLVIRLLSMLVEAEQSLVSKQRQLLQLAGASGIVREAYRLGQLGFNNESARLSSFSKLNINADFQTELLDGHLIRIKQLSRTPLTDSLE